MLDLFLGKKVVEKFVDSVEPTKETKPATTTKSLFSSVPPTTYPNILMLIGSIVFGIIAVWLSWKANTLAGWNVLAKLIFAIFAFLFGLVYVIIYLVCKLDLVNVIQKTNEMYIMAQ